MARTVRSRFGLSLALIALAPLACLAQTVTFNLPAQPLAESLKAVGALTNLNVMVSPPLVDGKQAPPLKANLPVKDALAKLLAGTGLEYHFVNDQTVVIRTKSAVASVSDPPAGQSTPTNPSDNQKEADKSSNSFRVAQVDQASAGPQVDATKGDVQEVRISVPEILVVGSRSLDVDIQRTRDDAQPYVVFDQAAIEKSGAQTVEEFFRRQTTLGVDFQSNSQFNTAAAGGGAGSSINLRGLGANQTLILIDGRRTAETNVGLVTAQPDLNSIPLAAIDRIEILPTTASGIYGGSATGGVINIILRHNYSGVETKLTYGDSFDGGGATRRMDLTAGFSPGDGRTNILVAGSYSSSTPLLAGDRQFLQSARALTLSVDPAAFFGNPFVVPLGNTTNIAGFDPTTFTLTNLTLRNGTPLNSPFTSVPVGYAGPPSDSGAGLAGNAGRYNFALANTAQFTGARQSLLNSPTIESLSATLRHEFSSDVQTFLSASAAENRGSFFTNNVRSTMQIPAGVPGNPFQQDIYINLPALGADQEVTSNLKSFKGSAGLIVSLAHGWRTEADVTWSENKYTFNDVSQYDTTAITGAISDGTLDVFRDYNPAGIDFSQVLEKRSPVPAVKTSMIDYAIRTSGPLWDLPAGPITLSTLLEQRREIFGAFHQINYFSDVDFEDFSVPSRSQSVSSVYSELLFPVVGERNGRPGVRLLEFQLAARWDSYKTQGANALDLFDGQNIGGPTGTAENSFTSLDPTLGLRFKPTGWLMLRGSYGSGFLPPNVNQLVSQLSPPSSFSFLTDPLRGNEPLGNVALISGGNAALKPEKSKSWSVGMVLTPALPSSLRLSADFTRIRKEDNIVQLAVVQQTLQELIDFAPNRVIRGAPTNGFSVGPITTLDMSALNFARQSVDALDLSAEYTVTAGPLGSFTLSSFATYGPHNQTQLGPTAPLVENAGTAFVGALGSVKWRANASLMWERGPWEIGWTTRYFSSYYLNTDHALVAIQGAADIPHQIYHDLFASYRVQAAKRSALGGVTVDLAISDIFNTRPPVDTLANGYSYLGDPRLASYFLSVRKSF